MNKDSTLLMKHAQHMSTPVNGTIQRVGLVGDLVQDGIARTKCSACFFSSFGQSLVGFRGLVARIGLRSRRDWGKNAQRRPLRGTCTDGNTHLPHQDGFGTMFSS